MKKILLRICICLFAALLTAGCATNPNSPVDPYEGYNRAMFKMNRGIDKVVLRPVAIVYTKVIPSFVQKGVGNILDNFDTLSPTLPNDILQGKIAWVLVDIWRVIINTTLGVGGLIDVASHLGIPKHFSSFGMTLAYWTGNHPSTYVVLPFFGPATFRSAFGRVVDIFLDPITYVNPDWLAYVKAGMKIIRFRAELLPADQLIQQAFDPYVFVRDAYMQNEQRLLLENAMRSPPMYVPPPKPVS
jgi:phospholipid-binding lipoprotein MlaA